ncbi:MAG: hypothetical protein NTZ80_02590 [Patescibacteria group bacterium]|nr:hypothetical protein [Patescibacteria group bacterium]
MDSKIKLYIVCFCVFVIAFLSAGGKTAHAWGAADARRLYKAWLGETGMVAEVEEYNSNILKLDPKGKVFTKIDYGSEVILPDKFESADQALKLSQKKLMDSLDKSGFFDMIPFVGTAVRTLLDGAIGIALWLWNIFSEIALSVALLLIVIGGFRMLISAGNQEHFDKGKENIILGIKCIAVPAVPAIILSLANWFQTTGSAAKTALGSGAIDIEKALPAMAESVSNVIITSILKISGAVAIVIFVVSAGFWIFSMGNEDIAGKGKKALTFSGIGLIVITMAYSIVRVLSKLAYGSNPGDQTDGLLEGNFLEPAIYMRLAATLMYILGPASLVALLYASYALIIKKDQDHLDRARKIAMYAIIGLVVALVAYAAIELITSISPEDFQQ